MKKRKLKNKEWRVDERAYKLYARMLKSKKCYKDCYLFARHYETHNGCITCPCCKNSPFYSAGDIYKYFRNKRVRREMWKEFPF